MTTQTSPRALTIKQAAAALQVSEASVRRYIAAGLLKARRVGPRLIRIDKNSLEKLMPSVESGAQ